MSLSKDERKLGWRSVPQPTPQQTAVLRRVAAGFLLRTQTAGGTMFSYDDGTKLPIMTKGGLRDTAAVEGMIEYGWLIPLPDESLIEGGPPQRYRARTIEDGLLPRFVRR